MANRLTRLFSSPEPEPAPDASRRREYASPALRTVDLKTIRPGVSLGADGDSWYRDLYTQTGGYDDTPELSGALRYSVYQEMRTSDPAVRSALWMYKLPIRGAMWTLEPPPDATPEEDLATEACRWQFGLEGYDGEMVDSWDKSLHTPLLKLDWGAMGEEIIWGDIAAFRSADGSSRLIRTIQRLAPRAPASIDQVERDEQTGLIVRLRQSHPDAQWIPGSKLAWYVFEQEGASIWGNSLLRAMYGAYRLKKGLLVSNAIAWDRWASGIPKVRYPHGGAGGEKERAAEKLAANLRTHERAYAALEGTAEQGWDVDVITSPVQDATGMLRYYDEQIALAALQMMKMLGGTPYGSRAGAEVLSDPYYLGVSAVAKETAAERRKQVFSRFVQVNFGEQVRPPLVKVAKLMSKNAEVLARALADAASAGLSFTDRNAQNDFRDVIEFDRLPEPTATIIANLPEEVGLEPIGEGNGIIPGQ